MEDIDLAKYTKNEGDKEMKYPKVKPKSVGFDDFIRILDNKEKETEDNIKNTETIISTSGQ